jgi:hypothetical protein
MHAEMKLFKELQNEAERFEKLKKKKVYRILTIGKNIGLVAFMENISSRKNDFSR